MTVEAGLAAKKPVSVCGEMAGNPRYVPLLIGLGVRTFSMAPARVGPVIDLMRRVTVPAARRSRRRSSPPGTRTRPAAMIERFDERGRGGRREAEEDPMKTIRLLALAACALARGRQVSDVAYRHVRASFADVRRVDLGARAATSQRNSAAVCRTGEEPERVVWEIRTKAK